MDKLTFLQLNLHNSYKAQEELELRIAAIKNPSIAILQEPPTPKKQIKYPKNYEHLLTPKLSRATIFIPKILQFTQITSLTTEYSTVVAGKIYTKALLIASIYLPPKFTNIPSWLINIIDHATSNDMGLLLAGDFNCHSPLWSTAQTKQDKGGELLETLIFSNGINIHNIGSTPTFRNSRNFTSCIDLTLSLNLPFTIQNWRVHDHIMNFSDHNTITFSTTNLDLLIPSFRPWHTMDWKKFTSILGKKTFTLPNIINHTALDNIVNNFNDTLTTIFDEICPMTKPKLVSSLKNTWHTQELKDLRKKVTKYFAHYKTLKTKPTLKRYRIQHRLYNRKCRQARIKSEKDFLVHLEQISTVSKF